MSSALRVSSPVRAHSSKSKLSSPVRVLLVMCLSAVGGPFLLFTNLYEDTLQELEQAVLAVADLGWIVGLHASM